MRPLHILSVDDDPALRMILKAFINSLGHRCTLAADGKQALQLYQQDHYDLVLMDQLMPGMDGTSATIAIRELQKTTGWRPIIMLSGMDQVDDQVASLNAGCDDFIAKPVNFNVLAAKINAFRRIAALQEQVAKQNQQLLHYHHAEAEERRISSFLMERLVRRDLLDRPHVHYLLQPAGEVSGDLLLACPSGNGDLYLMLADATGHGLPAALTLIPLSQTFYAMAAKGFSLDSIARELNLRNRTYSPIDRFVATLLVVFNPREKLLSVWNGGIPPALLLDEQGQILRKFKSLNLPLGIVDNELFESQCETLVVEPGQRLLLYSDGLIEAENQRGELFGQARLEQFLSQAGDAKLLDTLLVTLLEHLGECRPHDDLSCMLLDCYAPDEQQDPPAARASYQAESWQLQLTLSAPQLRRLDLVPMITSQCSTLGLDPDKHGVLSLILNELLSNALDHGVLALDSAQKDGPQGFERYFEMRSARLAALTDARIDIDIQQRGDAQGNSLQVRITDSGKGFDVSQVYAPTANPHSCQYHGRGLELVRNLSQRLEFFPPGNSVKTELRWSSCPLTETDNPTASPSSRSRASVT